MIESPARESVAEPPDGAALLYTTFPTAASAEAVGGELVERGMAACVNILGAVTAIYVWEGKRCRDQEVAMIVKTRRALAGAAIEAIRARHPYETPAIVEIAVCGGSPPFLDWIRSQTAEAAARHAKQVP